MIGLNINTQIHTIQYTKSMCIVSYRINQEHTELHSIIIIWSNSIHHHQNTVSELHTYYMHSTQHYYYLKRKRTNTQTEKKRNLKKKKKHKKTEDIHKYHIIS